MKLSKNSQVLLFSSIAAVATAFTFSQNFLQTDPTKLLKKTVEKAVQKWKNKLFLTPEQTELMRSTMWNFAVQKNKVLQLKINKEGKKERLQELQLLENEEMRKFLAESQYKTYLNLISEKVQSQRLEF